MQPKRVCYFIIEVDLSYTTLKGRNGGYTSLIRGIAVHMK